MMREHDLAITAFEKEIATLNRALSREKNMQLHRAMKSVRAVVTKAMAEFSEKKDKELAELQKKQGKDAPGRAEDLRHDWWNDEDAVSA